MLTKRVLGIVIVLVLLVASGVPFLVNTSPVAAETGNPYLVRTFIDDDGNEVAEYIDPGRPPEIKMAAVAVPEPHIDMGINTLSDVPAFDWCYGCSATSAAMMCGYYDRIGYPNMYAGPTNGGVCPLDNTSWGVGECPLSATHMGYDGLATRGHVDDYWSSYDSTVDPYYGNWTEHGYADCTADFMGTNQYHNWTNKDGATRFYYYVNGSPDCDCTSHEGDVPPKRDGCHGLKLFIESRGYSVTANCNQLIYGYGGNTLGFTFADYVAEIDAGRPVLIHIEGHTMLGFGYNTSGNIIYIHDTWDHSSHTMTWGGTYSGSQHYAVTYIRLASAPSPPAPPTLISPIDDQVVADTTVTFNWSSVAGANKYQVEVSPQSDFTPQFHWNGTSGTSFTYTDFPNDGTQYYWRARSSNDGGASWSDWSAAETFINGTGAPPAPPTLISPIDDQVVADTTVTFNWSSVAGANKYQVEVSPQSDFTPQFHWNGTSGTSFTYTDFPNDGTQYYWRARSSNDGGASWSDWSAAETFINGT
jgi:YD repeat-containing protein